MRGMILAAGLGTRLRPATWEIPKPLVPLCNRPLIGYTIDSLLAAGVRELIVNLHHLPEPLERWIEESYGERLPIHFSHEKDILGTGGAIRRVRPLLEGDEFVLVNGDTVQHPPLEQLIEARRHHDAIAALILRHPPEGDHFTEVFLRDGIITGIGEGTGDALMFAGCHAFSPAILDLLPDRDVSGIVEDVYLPLLRGDAHSLAGIIDDGYWFDIGTPWRYLSASYSMRRRMIAGEVDLPSGSKFDGDSIVDMSAALYGQANESVIGPSAVVASGATLNLSVMWEGSAIGGGTLVEQSILGFGVSIPSAAEIRNALVCRRIEGLDYPDSILLAGDLAAIAIDPGEPAIVRLES